MLFLGKHVISYIFMLTVMLLINLFLNSGSVECTVEIFSCVYSEIMFTIISLFQKLIKGGLE